MTSTGQTLVNSSGRNLAAPFQQQPTEFQKVLDATINVNALATGNDVDFRTHKFPVLQSYHEIKQEEYVGPTTESNWVIPNLILVGAYPATQDDDETYEILSSILILGIKKFVCLQQEYKPNAPEELWRAGLALRPYFNDVQFIVKNKTTFPILANREIVSEAELSFDHCPIVDCGITDDNKVLELSRKLVNELSAGQTIYLHCWGGHGRTGTVISIMLHLMYGLSATDAMNRCQFVHDLRRCPVDVGSPQTQSQRDQVTRIVNRLIQSYRVPKTVQHIPRVQTPYSLESQRTLAKPSKSFSAVYDHQTALAKQPQVISRFPYFHYSANNLNSLNPQQQRVNSSQSKVEPDHHSDALAKSASTTSTHSSSKSRKNSLTRKSVMLLKDQIQERNYSHPFGPGDLQNGSSFPLPDQGQLSSKHSTKSQSNKEIAEHIAMQFVNIDLSSSSEDKTGSKIVVEDLTKLPTPVLSPTSPSTTNNSAKSTASQLALETTTISHALSTARQSIREQEGNSSGSSERGKAEQVMPAAKSGGIVKRILPSRPTNLSTSGARFGVANFMGRKIDSSKATTTAPAIAAAPVSSTPLHRSPKGKDFLNLF